MGTQEIEAQDGERDSRSEKAPREGVVAELERQLHLSPAGNSGAVRAQKARAIGRQLGAEGEEAERGARINQETPA